MHNLFGTDGIRGHIGSIPFSDTSLERLSKALASWVITNYGHGNAVLIGHDTRISASWIKAVLKSSLLRMGISTYDAHVIPTPALYLLTRKMPGISAGIVISASHNPYQDNGIKLIDHRRGKILPTDEHYISQLYYQQISYPESYDYLGTDHSALELASHYVQHVISLFPPFFLAGTTIVLDCAHGAASIIAPTIFHALGATVIPLNNKPNGININDNCGAVHPEVLQKEVLQHNALIGFSFDGDADRVIAVNRKGVIKNGDDILALLLTHSAYQHTQTVVGTIMTNYGFEKHLKDLNRTLVRTNVGDKYIAEHLETHNLILGGEQSGHIILKDYLNTGDGIFTALRIVETILQTKNWDFENFHTYPQILISVPIEQKKDLKGPELARIIQHHEELLQAGRLVVRYSGTENVLRIMVEDQDLPHAQSIGKSLSLLLQKELSK